ncbi:aldo/keto reductase [Parvularcula marina]|uniref:aldo/keto reductase n=1 Tax=Parvularcula marina TaxID=2292771 RepID=UPI003514EFEC
MKTRKLGKTGLDVSEIGLGCWQFGGDFGPMEDDRAADTMTAAEDAGVNFFDTADVYGDGRSESLIGAYTKDRTERPVIATKVGRSARLYPDTYDKASIREHLLRSAERLGVEKLDLVQLHCIPPVHLKDGDVFDIMQELCAEGICRNWGASVETIEEAHMCLAHEGCSTLQIIFNLFRQDAVRDLLPAASKAGVGIIVRLPLASGLLTGKFSANESFPETDHRNYNADGAAFSVGETFNGIPLKIGVELVEELKTFVPDGMTLADFALRWILDHEAVSTVIAGCSRPDQVTANARASTLPALSGELHRALSDYYLDQVRETIRCPI